MSESAEWAAATVDIPLWKRAVGTTSLAAAVGLLLVVIATGSWPARIGAALGMLGVGAPTVVSLALQRREFADAEVSPSLSSLLTLVAGRVWLLLFTIAGYVAIILASVGRVPSWPLAIAAAVLLAVGTVAIARVGLHREGVEREVYRSAATFACYATIIASGVWWLFEVLAGAPQITALAFFTIGWGSFSAAASVLGHRSR